MPAVEEILRRSALVRVALPPATSVVGPKLGLAPVFELWAFASPRLYDRARKRFSGLHRSALDFAREFDLDAEQRAATQLVLQAYAWQLELFTAALSDVRPAVVLGIHFMLNPGFVGALRETEQLGARPTTLLLQHGFFSSAWETHDFIGADRVLLWGPRAASELAAFPGPTPQTTVVGNPRLEALARGLGRGEHGVRTTVLVLGTNDDTSPERQRDALFLVARGLAQSSTRSVLYRPHPAEPVKTYQDLIAQGLILEEQVRREGTVHEALMQADLVVGTTSTTILEAVSLGIPAIQVLPELFEVDWYANGMITASTPGSLAEVVDTIMTNPASRTAALELEVPVARAFLGESTGSARRIADAVMAEVMASEITGWSPGDRPVEA